MEKLIEDYQDSRKQRSRWRKNTFTFVRSNFSAGFFVSEIRGMGGHRVRPIREQYARGAKRCYRESTNILRLPASWKPQRSRNRELIRQRYIIHDTTAAGRPSPTGTLN